MKISFITHSDTSYGGIKIPPKSVGKHPQGGIKGISKPLGNHSQAPRSPYLHPMKAAPSTLGSGTFNPRSPYLYSFLPHFCGKIAFPCHPCRYVVTYNRLIIK